MARRSTKRAPLTSKQVEALKHEQAQRKNIPTAELQSAAQRMEEIAPFEPVTYKRTSPLAEGETRPRDKDLDPQVVWKGGTIRLSPSQIEELTRTGKIEIEEVQLTWRGKDQQDWSDLIVQAPPLYIQEKVHPKAIIDDLMRQTKESREEEADSPDLFADFNGVEPDARTEFYQHDQHWSNRMILGDSLQVMASLAERESLRGQVQCIYFDPPYGIKFNSNWQVSTQSRDVKDGKMDQITREPEQVKAFRDTWKDGIHSYLTYLRDRLTAMRDLLTDSGSIFVQIGDENVHRVRALMDEVFGESNFVNEIAFAKTTSSTSGDLSGVYDIVVWYAREKASLKYRPIYKPKIAGGPGGTGYTRVRLPQGNVVPASKYKNENEELVLPEGADLIFPDSIRSQSPGSRYDVIYSGRIFRPEPNYWKTDKENMQRLLKADRMYATAKNLSYIRKYNDFPVFPLSNFWADTVGQNQFGGDKIYVVQTGLTVVQRCMLMSTDPGDLVLDPTCGSGTTATVAEQWGRRWITVDTSRVALALARARIMGARYPYYLLADSHEGREQEQKISGKIQPDTPTHGDIRQGFVYERAPHITLKSIANNAEIDVIWESYQEKLELLRQNLNKALGQSWEEWEIPREAGDEWSAEVKQLHTQWWELRIQRQQEIDKSIAQKADVEMLYDRPYEDNKRVRVAGPFTVESLSPHRVVPADEEDMLGIDGFADDTPPINDFAQMVLDNLKSAGVHQTNKEDRISFLTIDGWPGTYICADGRFMEGEVEKRAAIFIGPEFGTVTRPDLNAAAREALEARFDVLVACGFNFEAYTSDVNKMGPLPILKAKMNPDLHMSEELKNTGKGNLFIVFGEPDIKWDFDKDGNIVAEVLGIDVFDPKTGQVRSDDKNGIAAWFIDTDYNEESFFVRHAYFLGANDPYKALKTALKAEVDKDAWETLYRDKSRPFPRPKSGRFAIKVINHFGDEVMKVFAV